MGFDRGLVRLLEHEGGYANDPRDSGGETYKGISRKWFPKWGGWTIIDSVEDKAELAADKELNEQVGKFYYAYFWMKIQAHEIENDFIAEMLFNFSVNMGKKVVAKKMQRVLQVSPDGIIGPKTILALNTINVSEFVFHFLLEIIEFYMQLGKAQPHYLRGWLSRALSFYYEYERMI